MSELQSVKNNVYTYLHIYRQTCVSISEQDTRIDTILLTLDSIKNTR